MNELTKNKRLIHSNAYKLRVFVLIILDMIVIQISSFLGEPEPYEIERKYLIEYPDLKLLDSLPNCEKVDIIQTYLTSNNDDEVRVSQRGQNGHYIYTKTTKRAISGLKRVEIEKRLSKDEYLALLMNADTSKRQIRKDRYCLTYENQYFEIDVYPFWNDKAIAEIELKKLKSSKYVIIFRNFY